MSVTPADLTGTERAVLLVLMAEARPVPNPDLVALGPKLDKPGRDKLNKLGLIESHRSGGRFVHELTAVVPVLSPAQPAVAGRGGRARKALLVTHQRATLSRRDGHFAKSVGDVTVGTEVTKVGQMQTPLGHFVRRQRAPSPPTAANHRGRSTPRHWHRAGRRQKGSRDEAHQVRFHRLQLRS